MWGKEIVGLYFEIFIQDNWGIKNEESNHVWHI